MPAAMQANGLAPVEPARRFRQHWVDLIFLGRDGVEHVQEVFRVAQVVARIDKRLPDRIFVSPGGDGRKLGDEAEGGDAAALRIVNVQAVVIERRQRADDTAHHRHRMRVAAEAIVKCA